MKENNRNRIGRKKENAIRIVSLIVLAVLVGAVIWVAVSVNRESSDGPSEQGTPSMEATGGSEDNWEQENQTTGAVENTTEAELPEAETQGPIALSDGLVITRIDSYAGIFMEDGSDEIVSDMMMLILENTTEQDLQLARVFLHYASFTAEFEVTNLPAGESILVLEKNRRQSTAEFCVSAEVKNVVFFSEPMDVQDGRLEISGGNGYIEVTNVSGEAITGDIYIYYKNVASDLLYGGITYRARIEGGLGVSQTVRIMTGHYTARNSRIVMITCGD